MASRILLADDSITIQKVVNLTFADEGIEVVAVSNGDVAERRLAEVKPDLVLADIFMPGKNGYELCEAIKESAQFRNVPVVLLVGAFEPFDQAEAQRVRADAHLTKPFESRTLVETVRRLISASPRTTTGPIAPAPAADDQHDEAFDARATGTAVGALASQLAGNLDLSAMADSSLDPSTQLARNTGDLGSPSPDAGQEAFDLGVVDAFAPAAVSATLTDTTERFEPLEYSPKGDFSPAETTPPFDLDTHGPNAHEFQDFDTAELVESCESQDPISLESHPSASLGRDITGAGEGENWFNPESFETTRLDGLSGDGAWRAASNGSPLSYQSPDFKLQTETGYSASEASTDTACATLAVDEPLGDVLFDESVSLDALTASEMSSNDSPGLDFMEAGVAETSPTLSTQFDLVDMCEASTAEASTAEVSAAEASTPEASTAEVLTVESSTLGVSAAEASTAEASTAEPLSTVEEKPHAEQLAAQETPVADYRPHPVPADQPFASHPASHVPDNDSDWTTTRAAAYSTAQLDSVGTSSDTAEYLAENAGGESAQQPESTEEASFTTASTWTEEEARFTPIDLEPGSVEEALPKTSSVAATGFEISSGQAEQPNATSETPFVPANGGPPTALSSAAIEEIVRRVVAEMSESVVREVAWEVVPDCVERVIEQLTRESLSKRA